jgi:membrane-associated phospholipid phosphatase
MKSTQSTVFRHTQVFWFGFCLYVLAGGFLLLGYQKGAFELLVNQYHVVWADIFFKYFTWVGDGIFYVAVAAGLFFYRRRVGILLLLSYAITGLAVQLLKIFVFAEMQRPKAFFGDTVVLRFVEGVEMHTHNSFPSGHTVSAFSLACVLVLWLKSPLWSIICLLCAVLVGFSRVYLLQHFFLDTYCGAILGTWLTALIFYLFTRKFPLSSPVK